MSQKKSQSSSGHKMKVKLRNNEWKLVRLDLGPNVRGEIDPPTYVNKNIKISTRLKKSAEILEVVLHECLHGCFWDLDEEAIDKAALDISRILHKLGARLDIEKVAIIKPRQQ